MWLFCRKPFSHNLNNVWLEIKPQSLGNCPPLPYFPFLKRVAPSAVSPWIIACIPSRNSLNRSRSSVGKVDSIRLLLSASIDNFGCTIIDLANVMAYSRTFSLEVSRFTSPQSYAYLPETALPVRIMSLARLSPMLLTNLTVPPSISGTPNLLQNTPKTASGCDTIISHQHASSSPPATACPSTAAMTGFDNVILEGPIGPLPYCEVFHPSADLLLASMASARSKPEQNVLSPQRMAI